MPNTEFAPPGNDSNPTATLVPDVYEPNNTVTTATDLGSASVTTSINFNSSSLSIDAANDQDWFKFTLGSTGAVGDSLRIGFSHTSGNLDLAFYRHLPDDSTRWVDSSLSSKDQEVISLAGLAPGTCVAKVFTGIWERRISTCSSFSCVSQIAPAQWRFMLPGLQQKTLKGTPCGSVTTAATRWSWRTRPPSTFRTS